MAQTSIHIDPVKTSSEVHNKRLKALGYVRPELSRLNDYWESDSQVNRLASIKARYLSATGQQMQKKATPIREGVIVIKDTTTMKELQNLAQELESRFGIRCFQIAIHKDEGHVAAKEWKPNLHAHMVFDWTDENGKSVKLRKSDMVEMQTIVANCLKMDRGIASDKKHLNAVQYKLKKRMEMLAQMEKSVGTGARILSFFGVGELASIRKELEAANKEIEAQKDRLTVQNNTIAQLKGKIETVEKDAYKAYKTILAEEKAETHKQITEAEKRANTAEKEAKLAKDELAKVREENRNLSYTVNKLTQKLWGQSENQIMRDTIVGDVLEFNEHPDYRDEWVATWRGYTVATAKVQRNGTVDITEWHPDQESTRQNHAQNLEEAWERIQKYTRYEFEEELGQHLGQGGGMRR